MSKKSSHHRKKATSSPSNSPLAETAPQAHPAAAPALLEVASTEPEGPAQPEVAVAEAPPSVPEIQPPTEGPLLKRARGVAKKKGVTASVETPAVQAVSPEPDLSSDSSAEVATVLAQSPEMIQEPLPQERSDAPDTSSGQPESRDSLTASQDAVLAQVASLQERLAEVESSLSKSEQQRNGLTLELEQQKFQNQALEQESARSLEGLVSVRVELNDSQTQLAEVTHAVRVSQDELGELQAEVDFTQSRLETVVAELGFAHEQLELRDRELIQARNALDLSRLELGRTAESQADLLVRFNALEGQLEQARAVLETTQARIAELELELEEANLLQEDLEETIVDRRREIRELRAGKAETQKLRLEAEELMVAVRSQEESLEQRLVNGAALARQREDELLRALNLVKENLRVTKAQAGEELALQQEQVVALQARLAQIEQEKIRTELRGRILEKDLKDALGQLSVQESRNAVSASMGGISDDVEVRLRAQVGDLQKALAESEARAAATGSRSEAEQWKKKFEEVLETLQTQRRQNEDLGNLLKVNQLRANEAEERCRELDIRLRNSLRARAREGG